MSISIPFYKFTLIFLGTTLINSLYSADSQRVQEFIAEQKSVRLLVQDILFQHYPDNPKENFTVGSEISQISSKRLGWKQYSATLIDPTQTIYARFFSHGQPPFCVVLYDEKNSDKRIIRTMHDTCAYELQAEYQDQEAVEAMIKWEQQQGDQC